MITRPSTSDSVPSGDSFVLFDDDIWGLWMSSLSLGDVTRRSAGMCTICFGRSQCMRQAKSEKLRRPVPPIATHEVDQQCRMIGHRHAAVAHVHYSVHGSIRAEVP